MSFNPNNNTTPQGGNNNNSTPHGDTDNRSNQLHQDDTQTNPQGVNQTSPQTVTPVLSSLSDQSQLSLFNQFIVNGGLFQKPQQQTQNLFTFNQPAIGGQQLPGASQDNSRETPRLGAEISEAPNLDRITPQTSGLSNQPSNVFGSFKLMNKWQRAADKDGKPGDWEVIREPGLVSQHKPQTSGSNPIRTVTQSESSNSRNSPQYSTLGPRIGNHQPSSFEPEHKRQRTEADQERSAFDDFEEISQPPTHRSQDRSKSMSDQKPKGDKSKDLSFNRPPPMSPVISKYGSPMHPTPVKTPSSSEYELSDRTMTALQKMVQCPCCYEMYDVTNRVPVKLACYHTFCRKCVDWVYHKSQTCPVCRTTVLGTIPPTLNLELVDIVRQVNGGKDEQEQAFAEARDRQYHLEKFFDKIKDIDKNMHPAEVPKFIRQELNRYIRQHPFAGIEKEILQHADHLEKSCDEQLAAEEDRRMLQLAIELSKQEAMEQARLKQSAEEDMEQARLRQSAEEAMEQARLRQSAEKEAKLREESKKEEAKLREESKKDQPLTQTSFNKSNPRLILKPLSETLLQQSDSGDTIKPQTQPIVHIDLTDPNQGSSFNLSHSNQMRQDIQMAEPSSIQIIQPIQAVHRQRADQMLKKFADLRYHLCDTNKFYFELMGYKQDRLKFYTFAEFDLKLDEFIGSRKDEPSHPIHQYSACVRTEEHFRKLIKDLCEFLNLPQYLRDQFIPYPAEESIVEHPLDPESIGILAREAYITSATSYSIFLKHAKRFYRNRDQVYLNKLPKDDFLKVTGYQFELTQPSKVEYLRQVQRAQQYFLCYKKRFAGDYSHLQLRIPVHELKHALRLFPKDTQLMVAQYHTRVYPYIKLEVSRIILNLPVDDQPKSSSDDNNDQINLEEVKQSTVEEGNGTKTVSTPEQIQSSNQPTPDKRSKRDKSRSRSRARSASPDRSLRVDIISDEDTSDQSQMIANKKQLDNLTSQLGSVDSAKKQLRRAKLDKGNGILIGKTTDHLKQYIWRNMLYQRMKPTLHGPSKARCHSGYQQFKQNWRLKNLVKWFKDSFKGSDVYDFNWELLSQLAFNNIDTVNMTAGCFAKDFDNCTAFQGHPLSTNKDYAQRLQQIKQAQTSLPTRATPTQAPQSNEAITPSQSTLTIAQPSEVINPSQSKPPKAQLNEAITPSQSTPPKAQPSEVINPSKPKLPAPVLLQAVHKVVQQHAIQTGFNLQNNVAQPPQVIHVPLPVIQRQPVPSGDGVPITLQKIQTNANQPPTGDVYGECIQYLRRQQQRGAQIQLSKNNYYQWDAYRKSGGQLSPFKWHWMKSFNLRRQQNGQSSISEAQTGELFMLLELEEDIKWPEDNDVEEYLRQVIWDELQQETD